MARYGRLDLQVPDARPHPRGTWSDHADSTAAVPKDSEYPETMGPLEMAGVHPAELRRSEVGKVNPDERWHASEFAYVPKAPLLGIESNSGSEFAVEIAGILDEIRREIGRDPEEARQAAMRLVKLLTTTAPANTALARGGLAPWQARKVDEYLRTHFAKQITVRELAKEIRLSVSHFYRAFGEAFGDTPHAYLLRLRVGMAQQLMLATHDPLTQIALECGFADLSHLSKAFRRQVGEPPSAWRRRNFTQAQDGLDNSRVTKTSRARQADRQTSRKDWYF